MDTQGMQDLEKLFAGVEVPNTGSDIVKEPIPETSKPPVQEIPVPPTPPTPPAPPTPPVEPEVQKVVEADVVPTPSVVPEQAQVVTQQPIPNVQVPNIQVPNIQAPVTPVAPVQTVPTSSLGYNSSTMQATSLSPSKVPDNFKIDLPEESKQALRDVGADVGEIGMKVSRIPIEKYRGSISKIDRISFITTSVVPVKYHYIEERKSSIVCFRGKCCSMCGNPTVRYLFPIAVYQTDAEGTVVGGKLTLMALSAGEDLYKSIMTINKGSMSFGGIDHVDLLVTCTDETYQKLSLVQAGPAIWRQYQPMANFLAETYQRDGDKIYMAVARKVDEDSFMKMIGNEASVSVPGIPQGQEGVPYDLSKYFNTPS